MRLIKNLDQTLIQIWMNVHVSHVVADVKVLAGSQIIENKNRISRNSRLSLFFFNAEINFLLIWMLYCTVHVFGYPCPLWHHKGPLSKHRWFYELLFKKNIFYLLLSPSVHSALLFFCLFVLTRQMGPVTFPPVINLADDDIKNASLNKKEFQNV